MPSVLFQGLAQMPLPLRAKSPPAARHRPDRQPRQPRRRLVRAPGWIPRAIGAETSRHLVTVWKEPLERSLPVRARQPGFTGILTDGAVPLPAVSFG